jgi:sugar lactone lactonase YvrE
VSRNRSIVLVLGIVAVVATVRGTAQAPAGSGPATSYAPPNDAPNPYQPGVSWGKLPNGRTWGSTAGVDIAPDGSIWAYDRCGANGCGGSSDDPIVHFDKDGKVVKSFGGGKIQFPHGFSVDKDGNVWVTDGQDNANANNTARGRGADAAGAAGGRGGAGAAAAAGGRGGAAGAAGAGPTGATVQAERGPVGAAAGATKGHQVWKFSPDGEVLMTLGTVGGAQDPGFFYQPNDVLVAPNGDIFVSEGHSGGGRILKFKKDGTLIKIIGKAGAGPGQFNVPHALAMDSRGRLFVGDRSNNRVQILDQDGTFIAEWKQFGRPSGIFIDRDDAIYVTDSESRSDVEPTAYGYNPGVNRGIRWGSARDGKVVGYIPDPMPSGGSSSSEGVAVDRQGNVYGAEVGPRDLKKYVKK